MLTSFGQSRIDSNSYKRIHYLDYAQVTQDVYFSLDNDTIFEKKGKLLHIDTIYYVFKFEPYPDELKKRKIKGEFKLYLLNEKNDTLYKSFNVCSDSILLTIPISKNNEVTKLLVKEKTNFRKIKSANDSFNYSENIILSLYIDNIVNLNIIKYGSFNIRCGVLLKATNNAEKVLRLYGFPIDDVLKKTVPGVY